MTVERAIIDMVIYLMGIIALFSIINFFVIIRNPKRYFFWVGQFFMVRKGKVYRIIKGNTIWEVDIKRRSIFFVQCGTDEKMLWWSFVHAAYRHKLKFGFTEVGSGDAGHDYGAEIGSVDDAGGDY